MKHSEDILIYHPFQPGYRTIENIYTEIGFSDDCEIGKYICQIFEVKAFNTSKVHVIPDGCNDILIISDGEKIISRLSPSIEKASYFEFEKIEWIFGIRFLPGATSVFLSESLDYSPLNSVDMKDLFADFEQVERDMLLSKSFGRRYEIMENFLKRYLQYKNESQLMLYRCVKEIIMSNGILSVDDLGKEAGYSSRYIRKLFAKYVGHSPKELAAIIRMQNALNYIWMTEPKDLVEASVFLGFSDQSHMNREFRKFLSITSGSVKNNENWILDIKSEINRKFK